jgi:hypothetical protein
VETLSDFEVVESPSQYWRWKRVNAAAKISGVPRSRLVEHPFNFSKMGCAKASGLEKELGSPLFPASIGNRTTKLYDRRGQKVLLEDMERIRY